MKKNRNAVFYFVLISGGLLMLTWGCTTTDYTYSGRSMPVVNTGESSVSGNSATSEQVASLRADIRQLSELYRELIARIQQDEETLEKLKYRLRNIENRMGSVQQSGSSDIANLRERVQQLASDLESERRARRQADKELVNTVSSEVATALAQVDGNRGRGGGGMQARGTYTVKKGDTLSAIARAFGVTVDDLKKINNLRSNLIRAEQKLLIPKE